MRTALSLLFLLALTPRPGAWGAIGDPPREERVTTVPKTSLPVPQLPGLAPTPLARAVKWDYFEYPVRSTSPSSKDEDFVFGTIPCFDGYPARVDQPSLRIYWNCAAPQPGAPVQVDIDYLQPVAVTRFVHYFDRVPEQLDATHTVSWKGWKEVSVLSSNNKMTWTPLQTATLERDYPQVIGIDQPVTARYYRIVIGSMLEPVPKLHTYEIETWYGTTVGNVTPSVAPVQSEPLTLRVRVQSSDAALEGATLHLTPPPGTLKVAASIPLPPIAKGGFADVAVPVTPLVAGATQMVIELKAGDFSIDQRPYTLRVLPKLALTDVTPTTATSAVETPASVALTATVTNRGTIGAAGVKASWLGQTQTLGAIGVGESAKINLSAAPAAGYSEGMLEVTGDAGERSILRRAVITPKGNEFSVETKTLKTAYWLSVNEPAMTTTIKSNNAIVKGYLMAFSEGLGQVSLKSVGEPDAPRMVGNLGGAVLVIEPGVRADGGEDPEFKCRVIPNDPTSLATTSAKFSIRFMVNDPKKLFRPHLDLFDKGQEPKNGWGGYVHYATTRMLAVQNDVATVSMVPSTDNLIHGYETDMSLNAYFDVDLPDPDPLKLGIWQPIGKGPREFSITLPIRPGDWWDSYRHVVHDIFKFEQARQWALPMTQLQMLSAREMMREENWSNQFQTMRSFPNADVFYNFYGTTYTVPAMFTYYLATDDLTAKKKAEAVVKWLINHQVYAGPMAGAWFSQYIADKGTDQAGNEWLLPHSTGTSAKTLLWYYTASGSKDAEALAAARRGCDFLVANQSPDGSWPYAYDIKKTSISSQSDAGQIWCAWALWELSKLTGEESYKAAALRYKDFFVEHCYKTHTYSGYWEDVSGSAGNPASRSSETYEAALAAQAFIDMGDPQLAVEVAKDSAVSHWTRVTTTRQYETQYGQTVEQGAGGPSQAQSPMSAIAMERIYELTHDTFWSDLAGAVKAINFCADPDSAYGMCAIAGWDESLTGVIAPPYDNANPLSAPGSGLGRPVWNEWQTAQYTWLALEWLIREANIRAPDYVKIDPGTLRGTVLGKPGRVKMPEERCDVTAIDHLDVNWTGYRNDDDYMLVVMNHQQKTSVAIRPHEAHLDVFTKAPKVLVGVEGVFAQVPPNKRGVQYFVEIPAKGTAILVWERIR